VTKERRPGVRHSTTKSALKGRLTTSAAFLLLQRIVHLYQVRALSGELLRLIAFGLPPVILQFDLQWQQRTGQD
jgi:hypothetical protein